MRDLALLAFFGAFLAAGIRRPFLWILLYLYVDIVAPQKIAWGILAAIPVSLITFVAAFGGWAASDDKRDSRFTLRQGLIAVLLVYCGYTTLVADFPVYAALKWDWVWKALIFAMFLPLTLRTRLRIEAVVLTMVLSAATIIINGGVKTVFGGGGYGELSLLVNNNTGLYEGSIISTVAVAIIPLIFWLTKHGTIFPPDWRVKLFAAGLIFACLLMPVGTSARTGLVCLAFLCVIALRTAKRRFLYLGLMLAAGVIAVPFLPQSFVNRMSTIENHQSDESASTRIAVWKWTWQYAKDHPLGGGFDAYRGNKIRYYTHEKETSGNTTEVEMNFVEDASRAYHSSYFEMLGEQGYPGIVLWLWLQVLGLWQMERLRRRWKNRDGANAQWQAPLANALQQAQLVYLLGSLFVGIAYLPFALELIAVQCGLWTYLRRIDAPQAPKTREPRRLKPVGAAAAG